MADWLQQWGDVWRRIARMPVLHSMWRVGYGKRDALIGFGWRRIFWRFWWLDVAAERRLLEKWAWTCGVCLVEKESNKSLRARIRYVISVPPGVRQEYFGGDGG